MIRQRHHGEAGLAIASAILLVVIVTIVLSVVVSHMTGQAGSSKRHSARTASLDAAGAGVQALQQALVAGQNADVPGVKQGDGFSIDPASLSAAAAVTGGQVVPNASLPYQLTKEDAAYGGMPTAVRGPVQPDGSRQVWQVVQALAPSGTSPWLTLYVRAWTETGNGSVSEAAVMKARLKPGSLADFQLLSDTPIKLETGATLNGRVHSNGSIDEWSPPPPPPPNADDVPLRIWTHGPVVCQSTGGVKPTITTARGSINIAAAGGCDVRDNTGEFVPLDSARDSVVRMRGRSAAAGSDVVAIGDKGANMTTTPATAVIGATTVRVTYPGQAARTISTPAGDPMAIVFDRDVRVTSTAPTTARLTIATWSAGVVGRPAPSITIASSITRANPSAGPRALGLLAEKDIVIDPTSSSGYPQTIQAALYAMTGGVRLPLQYTTPTRVTAPTNFYPPVRPSLNVLGSITSHSSIALRWSWGTQWIGYTARQYSWDPWLATYPPPYWPAINPWEIVDQTEANADCYGATGKTTIFGGAACR